MLVERIWTGNALRNFNYLIACPDTGEALAIDPLDHAQCLATAKARGWNITQILNTHEHNDHIGGNAAVVEATGAKIIAHHGAASKIPGVDRAVGAGDVIKVGKRVELECMDTPGHTMCHICLKSRTDMWHKFVPKNKGEANEVADLKGSDCRAVECNGAAHCERDNRSLACRTFPFFPYFNTEKELIGLSYYWSFEGLCWVISNITIVEKPFIRQFLDVHEYLFKADENWRDTYIEQSSTMRGVYSRKNERFPVILRDGTYHWVLPKSGGRMVKATKAELGKLKARFNPDKIGMEKSA